MENKSSNQFWIDVSTDRSYLAKKSNVLRWSLLKYDISMETFWSVFFYSFVIHKLIPIKSVLCQHNYSFVWWIICNCLFDGFLYNSLILLVWLLNQFQLVTIYWLVCRDRNLPLCHTRVSLTSCIGAGHIIFFAGIDFTENQVTLWTSCSCNCLFVCLYLIWSSFLMIWRLTDPSSDSFSCSCSLFFFFFFSVLHVFYVVVLPCSFCLFWFQFLSVFRIIISANTFWRENYNTFTDYLFLAGCLCSCGSSYAVFPDGQFLLDACRGDLYLFICCKGLQH